jgi:hypothetical protein
MVLDLLFELAVWHAHAKLRLHTETTLEMFQSTTQRLGVLLRAFLRLTCEAYITRELPRETAARGRREAALATKGKGTKGKGKEGPKRKRLNLATYKYHALGDYPEAIRRFGTTDNYSTQVVCSLTVSRQDF